MDIQGIQGIQDIQDIQGIPVIIIDGNANIKDRVVFIEASQLHKPHMFLPVLPQCYARLATPAFTKTPVALILNHRKGQHPSLQSVDVNTLDFIKKMTIGRYAITRALNPPLRRKRPSPNATSTRLNKTT